MPDNNSNGITLLDTENEVSFDDDKAVFKRTQNVDDSLLDRIADKRLSTQHSRMGDMHHVASVPTVIVEKWMAEGFNIFDKNVTIPEILRRLQSEDMQRLIATSKNIT